MPRSDLDCYVLNVEYADRYGVQLEYRILGPV
jgi:hypothetical protein